NRQTISCGNEVAVAASAVVTVSRTAAVTIVRRRPARSASRPTPGAANATAMTGAVIVRPTWNADASKVRARSGSSGCVAYRSRNAANPARTTGRVGTRAGAIPHYISPRYDIEPAPCALRACHRRGRGGRGDAARAAVGGPLEDIHRPATHRR